MAFSTEAYWEAENNQGVTDRIEIQEDSGSGRNLELGANDQGFKWRLSEITSESDDGLINPLANKIQVGKLTFFPRIETSAEQALLDDILGSPDTTFRIVWKQDGSVFWTGNIDNKRRSYPETGGSYFATIRANDFEILKSIDYTLDDTRQTLITTIADLLGNLNFGLKIRTATSWITEDTTDSTDFLSQIYHETKALRDFGRTGDETDQPISVWDALLKVGDPALLFRQVNGEFTVEQLTEFDDPANVHETVYTSAGAVDTSTTTVDRTLDADKATSEGSLVVKDGSQNDRYPAIKRARATFNHRSQLNYLRLPRNVTISGSGSEDYSEEFAVAGDQQIELSATVVAKHSTNEGTGEVDVMVRVGQYYYNGTSWVTDSNARVTIDLVNPEPGLTDSDGNYIYQPEVFSRFDITTQDIPSDANSPMEVIFYNAVIHANPDVVADSTSFTSITFSITNLQDDKANSTAIVYELEQSDGYTTRFDLGATVYGDGPNVGSPSALRYTSATTNITSATWQRRGSTSYRSFHKNLLKEVLDLQRSNTRKLNAEFWGTYDPSKILVYDSQNFYCAGVSYTGHLGRWSANLFRINVQTGSDDFGEALKYDPASSSVSSDNGASTSLKDVFLEEDKNLSDLNSASAARQNLGLEIGADVQAHSSSLDTYSSNPLTAGELGQLQNIDSVTITNTQWGYLGAMDQGVSTSDNVVFVTAEIQGNFSVTNGGTTTLGNTNINGTLTVDDTMTFNDDVFVLRQESSGFVRFEVKNTDTSPATSIELLADNSGNPIIRPNELTGASAVDLAFNNSQAQWEIDGNRILVSGDAQTLSYNQSTSDLSLSDGGGTITLDTFGAQTTFNDRVDIKHGADQLRLYDSSDAEADYFGWNYSAGSGLQLYAHDASETDAGDINETVYTVDFVDGKVTFNQTPAIPGGDAVSAGDLSDYADLTATQAISANWHFIGDDSTLPANSYELGFRSYYDSGGSTFREANIQHRQLTNTSYSSRLVFSIAGTDVFYGTVDSGGNPELYEGTSRIATRTHVDQNYVKQSNAFDKFYLSDAAGQQDIEISASNEELVMTAGSGLSNSVSGSTVTYSLDASFSDINGTAAKSQLPSTTAFKDENETITGQWTFDGHISGGTNIQMYYSSQFLLYQTSVAGGNEVMRTDASYNVSFNENGGVTYFGSNMGDMTPTGGTYIQVGNTSSTSRIEIIAGSSAESILEFGDGNDVDVGNIKYIHSTDTISFKTGGTGDQLTIDSNGDLTASGDSYALDHKYSSDRRLKSDLREIDPLHVASFATAYSFEKAGNRYINLIAQDIEQAGYDELIGWKDHSEYGQIRTLSAGSIGAVALAGVGALDSKQDRQTELISKLRGRVAELEQQVKRLEAA